jgi:hypothetical protein
MDDKNDPTRGIGKPIILLADAFLSHLYELADLERVEVKIIPRSKEPLGRGQRLFTGTAHDKLGNVKTNDPEIYRAWLRELKDRHNEAAEKYPLFEYLPCKKESVCGHLYSLSLCLP